MPKLPRQDTKHSAMPATSGGVISGSTIVRRISSGLRAGGESGLDQLLRQRAQARAQREEHERRVLDAEQRHDAFRRIERIAAAHRAAPCPAS